MRYMRYGTKSALCVVCCIIMMSYGAGEELHAEEVVLANGEDAATTPFFAVPWEKSTSDVEALFDTELTLAKEFYNLLYPPILDMNRYKARVQSDMVIFGETEITYVFFDDKLFEVNIVLRRKTETELHQYILARLRKLYGDGLELDRAHNDLWCEAWENEKLDIYYLLRRHQITEEYVATLKFTYKPIYAIMEEVSAEEGSDALLKMQLEGLF